MDAFTFVYSFFGIIGLCIIAYTLISNANSKKVQRA